MTPTERIRLLRDFHHAAGRAQASRENLQRAFGRIDITPAQVYGFEQSAQEEHANAQRLLDMVLRNVR